MSNVKSKLTRRDYLKMSMLSAGALVLPGVINSQVLNIDDFSRVKQKSISLFNGKDLSGWKYQDSAPFTGKTASSDSRFTVNDGVLRVNSGEGIQKIWTAKEFGEDFILTLEFCASVNADSGIYLRGPQLQCRDYLLAGPYKDLKKYKPQDWNQIEVVVRGQNAICSCNGEILNFEKTLPLKGPIGLEADRNQMDYRNIQITFI